VKKDFTSLLRCPHCGASGLQLEITSQDEREVREGRLRCDVCGEHYPIQGGIPDLQYGHSSVVDTEVQAWEGMLAVEDFTGEHHAHAQAWNRALPYLEGMEGSPAEQATWKRHGDNFFRFIDKLQIDGARILEIGAGRCWASAALARRGAQVVALDVMRKMYMGLSTADLYLEECHFERVLADMHNLPFADGTFDMVFATATLHHAYDPDKMLQEFTRVLVPGGSVLAVNEPVETSVKVISMEEVQGVNENVYTLAAWTRLFRRRGYWLRDLELQRSDNLNLLAVAGRESAGKTALAREWAMFARRELQAVAVNLGLLANHLRKRLLYRLAGVTRLSPGWPAKGYLAARRGRAGEVPSDIFPGRESGTAWLGNGWYKPESMPLPARWTGRRAHLVVGEAPGATRIGLHLASFRPGLEISSTIISVSLDGRVAGEAEIGWPAWNDFYVQIPPELKGRGVFHVLLEVKQGYYRPTEVGGPPDLRLLGVACARIWTE